VAQCAGKTLRETQIDLNVSGLYWTVEPRFFRATIAIPAGLKAIAHWV
jgi:hypothetical protein